MFAPHEPRLPYALTGLVTGLATAWIASEVLDLPGLPAPWPLALAVAALLAAVVARRVARALPAAAVDEDPFAFLDAVQADAPAPARPRHRAWPLVRGVLAAVGAATLLTGATVAAGSVLADPVRKLFGASASCTLGERYEPAERNVKRSDAGRLDGHRTLKSFEELPDGAGSSR